MKTLILGASENLERYSNKAIRSLLNHGHEVIAIAKRKGKVLDVIFDTDWHNVKDVDTISLYINAHFQKEVYNEILKTAPRRIIFNPGTENEELKVLANEQGIICQEACTLVLLATNQF